MENLDEKFNELVRKAEEELSKKQKNLKIGLWVFEVVLQLIGFTIIYIKLGGWVTLGVFILSTGNGMQIMRNVRDYLHK